MKKIFYCLFLILTGLHIANYAQELDLSLTLGTESIFGNNDEANVITIDADSNIYITGKGSASLILGQGETNETTLTNGMCFIAKYTKSGSLVWAKELGTLNYGISSFGLKVSADGNVYVVGEFYNEAAIGGTDVTLSGQSIVAFLIKYDKNGNYSWSKTMDSPGIESCNSLFIDENENIYITGTFQNSIILDINGTNEQAFVSRGNADVFVAKYSKDGDYLWGTEYGSENNDYPTSIFQINNESFCLVSNIAGSIQMGDHTTPDTSITEYYLAGLIVQFGLNGDFEFASKQGIDVTTAAPTTNGILISGRFVSNTPFYTEDSFVNLPNESEDYNSNFFVASIDSKGYLSWVKGFYSKGYEQGLHLSVDNFNHFYLSVTFSDSITLGLGERNETIFVPVGGTDFSFANFLMACFTIDGKFVWANQAYGDGGFPNDFISDPNGNTYLASTFTGTTTIRSGQQKTDTFVAKGYSDILVSRFNSYSNYPPHFSLIGNNQLIEDFNDTITYTFKLDSIPLSETEQIVTYSLDSVKGDILNYAFDNQGVFTVSSIDNKNGDQVFYFSADDGAAENYKALTTFIIHVDPVNDVPEITGLAKELIIDEDTPITLTVNDLIINDPDNNFPDDFTLHIYPWENYTFENTTIVPELNFNGAIQVSSTVSDGITESRNFMIDITVTPVNDAPIITDAVDTLYTYRNTPFEFLINYLAFEDIDNTNPDDFMLEIQNGENYIVEENTITPAMDFVGNLTLAVKVSDGATSSESFDVNLEVRFHDDIAFELTDTWTIAPNPFNNELVIHGNSLTETEGVLRIFDMEGCIVMQKILDASWQHHIKTTELKNGVYFLQIQQKDRIKTFKLIKE